MTDLELEVEKIAHLTKQKEDSELFHTMTFLESEIELIKFRAQKQTEHEYRQSILSSKNHIVL